MCVARDDKPHRQVLRPADSAVIPEDADILDRPSVVLIFFSSVLPIFPTRIGKLFSPVVCCGVVPRGDKISPLFDAPLLLWLYPAVSS